MFEHLSDLRGLNLTGNTALESIHESTLVPLKSSLIRFSFDKCNFSNIDPDAISILENNGLYIWAGTNPWNCNCKIQVCFLILQELFSILFNPNIDQS